MKLKSRVELYLADDRLAAEDTLAAVLQLHHGFLHGSLNCEDLHPKIEPFRASVVRETRDFDIRVLAKSSFGFGDVNGCVIFRAWKQ